MMPTASEDDLQTMVLQTAALCGWRFCHFRPARTAQGWRTPVQGHRGFPDVALAKDGRFLAVELKGPKGKPSPDQLLWLAALGDHGRLWRPTNEDEIKETLR